ncbi:hypothetical protein J6590_087090 [Homalodisca vitripennis]|nr:hypothetical protein J6590_087090 [Homalodisca vitripennis]
MSGREIVVVKRETNEMLRATTEGVGIELWVRALSLPLHIGGTRHRMCGCLMSTSFSISKYHKVRGHATRGCARTSRLFDLSLIWQQRYCGEIRRLCSVYFVRSKVNLSPKYCSRTTTPCTCTCVSHSCVTNSTCNYYYINYESIKFAIHNAEARNDSPGHNNVRYNRTEQYPQTVFACDHSSSLVREFGRPFEQIIV